MQKLNLYNNSITNVAPLTKLKKLEKLGLSNNYDLRDIGPLANLHSLKEFSFGKTLVSDLRPLSGLQSLESLSFQVTRVKDLTPLASLTNLKRLSMGYNQFEDISAVEECRN